jgi:rhodanese-related sulfurtransferase
MNPLEIDCQAVKTRLDEGAEFLLLDCRERDEYDAVHISQATLLPMSEIQERVEELSPHKTGEIVVYCHHGMRSLNVTIWLRQQGYANVKSMSGGIDEWAVTVDRSLPRY